MQITSYGSGTRTQVRNFSNADLRTISTNPQPFVDFIYGNAGTLKGVRVAAKDLDGDNREDLIVGSAPTAGTSITAYSGINLNGSSTGASLFSFDAVPGSLVGVFVG